MEKKIKTQVKIEKEWKLKITLEKKTNQEEQNATILKEWVALKLKCFLLSWKVLYSWLPPLG